MDDLISRQTAIDAVIAEGRDVDSRYLLSERIIHEADAVEAISMLPSAQPKRGKWIHDDNTWEWVDEYVCDQCGEKTTSTVMGKPRWNYCPNCGSYNGGDA